MSSFRRSFPQRSLKALQGVVWKDGYASGKLRGAMFDDVRPTLQQWTDAGIRVYAGPAAILRTEPEENGNIPCRASCTQGDQEQFNCIPCIQDALGTSEGVLDSS